MNTPAEHQSNSSQPKAASSKNTGLWIFILFLGVYLFIVNRPNGPTLTPENAHQKMQDEGLVIIDVRQPIEWRQTGVGVGVKTISMPQTGSYEAFVASVSKTVDNQLNQPVALICATGSRSKTMQKVLLSNGFTEVYDISAGMMGGLVNKGWIASDLPTSKNFQ